MNRRARMLLALSLVAAAIAVTPRAALAQSQATSSFNVTLTVPVSCSVSAQAIAFPYQPTGSPEATADITVNCPDGTDYKVGLDEGLHGGGATREMWDLTTGDFVPYFLFKDAAHSQDWGDRDLSSSTGAPGTSVGGAGAGSPQTLTIYGQIPGPIGGVGAGTFSDTVNVIVEF